jgi:hypothetical protein
MENTKTFRRNAIKMCSMNSELENAKQISLDYGGTSGWRETLKCKKWLSYDVEIIIRKIIICKK